MFSVGGVGVFGLAFGVVSSWRVGVGVGVVWDLEGELGHAAVVAEEVGVGGLVMGVLGGVLAGVGGGCGGG